MLLRILAVIVLVFPVTAYAEIYKYVDNNGVVMLTDTPQNAELIEIQKSSIKNARAKPSDSDKNYKRIIAKKAKKYELDPSLVSAVITAESNFRPYAVSKKGAMGLMQLMPGTAREMGVSNPYDPEQNIEGGTRYLRYLLNKYNGDLSQALAAYNAGPRRVETQRTLPGETRRYVKKVYTIYKDEDNAAPREKETVIYRVVLDNGKVFYTNHLPGGVDTSGF